MNDQVRRRRFKGAPPAGTAAVVAYEWAILGRFVGTRLPTRVLPIRIVDEERSKRIVVGGVLDGPRRHEPALDGRPTVAIGIEKLARHGRRGA